jgi:hypothetical protein
MRPRHFEFRKKSHVFSDCCITAYPSPAAAICAVAVLQWLDSINIMKHRNTRTLYGVSFTHVVFFCACFSGNAIVQEIDVFSADNVTFTNSAAAASFS